VKKRECLHSIGKVSEDMIFFFNSDVHKFFRLPYFTYITKSHVTIGPVEQIANSTSPDILLSLALKQVPLAIL
jgi:hypothetical protein